MIPAEIDGDVIVVDVPYHMKALIAGIPGATWKLKAARWELPLTWASCLALRSTFSKLLEIGPGLTAWAWAERACLDSIAEIKSATPEGQYGYQESGIAFLGAARSALLGDEMGLGKTRQAIMAADLPCLVVCPNSMKYTWKKEWEKWRTGVRSVVVTGTAAQRRKILEADYDVYIVNWEALRAESRLEKFGSMTLTESQKKPGALNRPWATVIADEAHRAKDPKAQQTRALWAVGASSARRIALTGTPVSNSPLDLWSVMHFVEPSSWPSRSKYIDRYCVAGMNFWGGLAVSQFRQEMKEELFGFLDPSFLRRTKKEVLPWLPPMTRQTIYLEMPAKQAKAYNSMRDEMIAELDSTVLVATDPMLRTLRLLQLASATPVFSGEEFVEMTNPSCKLEAVKDILDSRDGAPTVFFTVSRKLAEFLAANCGVEHIQITGAVGAEARALAVEAFQGGDIPAAFVTVGAGGEGITLTAADTAVFVQRPWSLVQSLQAEARIHRIGQESDRVEIIDLVTQGTVEFAVHGALGKKEGLLQEVVRDADRLRSLWGGEQLA